MLLDVSSEHIEISDGVCGGKPRIAGRRITVHDIAVWHERLGTSADEIASEYELSLAEIHAALAYYFDHRAEIDQQLAEEEQFVNTARDQHDSLLEKKREALHSHENANSVLPG